MIVVVPYFRLKSLVLKLMVYYQQNINLIPDQILAIMKTTESNCFLKCHYKNVQLLKQCRSRFYNINLRI